MNNEVIKMLAHVPEEMESYSEISKLASKGQYNKALLKVRNSSLSSSTREHLQKVLASGDKYIVDKTFNELNTRIAQALCWDCWK